MHVLVDCTFIYSSQTLHVVIKSIQGFIISLTFEICELKIKPFEHTAASVYSKSCLTFWLYKTYCLYCFVWYMCQSIVVDAGENNNHAEVGIFEPTFKAFCAFLEYNQMSDNILRVLRRVRLQPVFCPSLYQCSTLSDLTSVYGQSIDLWQLLYLVFI